ncbi:MAG: SIS domain-containing protein [Enterobacteriaceae bacterium]
MSDLFSYSEQWLHQHQGWHTAREIAQQPRLWPQLYQQLSAEETRWRAFLEPVLAQPNVQIILCGAGSSAFIGRMLAPWLREQSQRDVIACSTTDIVSAPRQYLSSGRPTLLVSFARSGKTPESIGAVQLADTLLPQCHHLLLTCEAHSPLAGYAQGRDKACLMLMPAEANDQGFAMTSSVSCMLIAALLLLDMKPLRQQESALVATAMACQGVLSRWQEQVHALGHAGFGRVLVLGSGCFTGLAEEGALKILELSAGKVATRYDSSLGVRHGPKLMIDAQTLVVVMLSSDPYCRRYDLDLLHELQRDNKAQRIVVLSDSPGEGDFNVNCGQADNWLILPFMLFLQWLALEISLSLGITPDNPCPTGEANRVVKGVTLYPFPSLSQPHQR